MHYALLEPPETRPNNAPMVGGLRKRTARAYVDAGNGSQGDASAEYRGCWMKVFDRMLARFVPQEDAGACSEYRRCYQIWEQICYVGCGRPTFCRSIGRCGA